MAFRPFLLPVLFVAWIGSALKDPEPCPCEVKISNGGLSPTRSYPLLAVSFAGTVTRNAGDRIREQWSHLLFNEGFRTSPSHAWVQALCDVPDRKYCLEEVIFIPDTTRRDSAVFVILKMAERKKG